MATAKKRSFSGGSENDLDGGVKRVCNTDNNILVSRSQDQTTSLKLKFKIPKKSSVPRCGQCGPCLSPPCHDCVSCNSSINPVDGDGEFSCLRRTDCVYHSNSEVTLTAATNHQHQPHSYNYVPPLTIDGINPILASESGGDSDKSAKSIKGQTPSAVDSQSSLKTNSIASSPSNKSLKMSNRCLACDGCLAEKGCQDCVYCTSNDVSINLLCSWRTCKNPIKKGRGRPKKTSLLINGIIPNLSNSPVINPLANGISPVSAVNGLITSECGTPLDNSPENSPMTSLKKQQGRCGNCEGCLRVEGCGTCGFCTNGNERMKSMCITKRCQNKIKKEKNNEKQKKVKSVKCGNCEGCKFTEFCGSCSFCKSENGKQKFLCIKRRCLNKIKPAINGGTSTNGETVPNAEPVKRMKKTKCGQCTGCTGTACTTCSLCTAGRPWLCQVVKCQTPVLVEVIVKSPKVPKPPKEPKPPKPPKEPKSPATPRQNLRKRCEECEGCASAPCGDCEPCQSVPDLCVLRVCLNPKSRAPAAPKIGLSKQCKENVEGNIGQNKNSNPKRYARCMQCDGCKADPCGACKSCKIYNQFKDKIRDPVTCEEIVCKFPVNLYGTRLEVNSSGSEEKCKCDGCTRDPCGDCSRCQDGITCELKTCQNPKKKKKVTNMRHEDGCCPLKVINGEVYDFRCYFCKSLPRVGSANRSELYRHYSVYHYANEIKAEFGRASGKCVHCKAIVKGGSFISHMGQVHNEVEKYLPDICRVPSSVQGKGGGRLRSRRMAMIVKVRKSQWLFPEIPENYNPKGEKREIDLVEETNPTIEIDGFILSNEIDEDEEPIFCSREDPIIMPDYEHKQGFCCLCKSTFDDIEDAVIHIHKRHNILGGSQHIMLDADRLLKGGYLSIPID